jgi:transcriptional regulator with XRE-family HTH domain
MKALGPTLRLRRMAKGLSQSQVATQAQVSLATLQNIENQRANPSIGTLAAVCEVLDLELSATPKWQVDSGQQLVQLGVPLMETADARPGITNRDDLIAGLSLLAESLRSVRSNTREAKALASFLWAIHDHYPSVWVGLDQRVRHWFEQQKSATLSIKLRRISLSRLGEYL